MNIIGFTVSCEIDYGKYSGRELVIAFTSSSCGLYVNDIPLIIYNAGYGIDLKLDPGTKPVVTDLMFDLYNKSKSENGCIDIKEIAKIAKKVYSILLPRTYHDDMLIVKYY